MGELGVIDDPHVSRMIQKKSCKRATCTQWYILYLKYGKVFSRRISGFA